MDAAELRQRAAELEADVWLVHSEDRRAAGELLVAALLRRAQPGEAGSVPQA
jgi:hypothetical protein